MADVSGAAAMDYEGFFKERLAGLHAEERYRVFAMLNFVGNPLTCLLGYAPGWSGLGEDLPRDAFSQWVRWVNSPRYLFDDKSLTGLGNFAKYTGALAACRT